MNRQLNLLLSIVIALTFLIGFSSVSAEQMSRDSLTAFLTSLSDADFA